MTTQKATDQELDEAARRMARACRYIIEPCLMEAEWKDADEEFFTIIRKGLGRLLETHTEGRVAAGPGHG